MNRRQFLWFAIGGLSTTAGCVSPIGRSSPTPSPHIESRVEVPSCPTKPRPLTTENVGPFAIQFEKAYFTRKILRENERVTYVEFLSIDESPEITHVENGYIIRIGGLPAYGYRPNPGTPETAHADFPQYTFHYFISEENVLRTKTIHEETANPRENGTVVHCPPQ